jgi:hypothetical protein
VLDAVIIKTLWLWEECNLSAEGILENDGVKREGAWKSGKHSQIPTFSLVFETVVSS